MTREIKFRAWDKETKKMHYQLVKPRTDKNTRDELIIQFDCTGYSARTQNKFIGSDCLMQYTGLDDKNGKEIYKSDIIKFDGYNAIFKVAFESAGFVVQWVFGEAGVPFGGSLSACDFQRTFTSGGFNFEVIGNIYENKDLIDN